MVAAARGRRKTGYHRAIGREPRLGKSKRETARGGCTRAPFPNPISATLPTPPAPYGELQPELLSHPQPQCGWWWPARRPRVNNPDPSCVRVVDETRAGAAAPSSPRKRKVPNYGRDAREGGPGSLFARAIQQCRSKAAALLAWPGHGRERRREPFREADRVVRAGGRASWPTTPAHVLDTATPQVPLTLSFRRTFFFSPIKEIRGPSFLPLSWHSTLSSSSQIPNPKSQLSHPRWAGEPCPLDGSLDEERGDDFGCGIIVSLVLCPSQWKPRECRRVTSTTAPPSLSRRGRPCQSGGRAIAQHPPLFLAARCCVRPMLDVVRWEHCIRYSLFLGLIAKCPGLVPTSAGSVGPRCLVPTLAWLLFGLGWQ